MSRAYLRLDPAFFDRKVIDQKYPPGAAIALVGALCHAEHQPNRGRFRDVRVLKALLGPLAKWIPFLIDHGDLIAKKGELYVDGWDEWQEGDWKVGERVKRIRGRQRAAAENADPGAENADPAADVTVPVTVGVTPDVTVGTVYNLSDGDRQSVIDSGGGKRSNPPTPRQAGGRASRANGTNPRAIAAAEAKRAETELKAKRSRRQKRQNAYYGGLISEAQLIEMNDRDAPVDELPSQAQSPLAWSGAPT